MIPRSLSFFRRIHLRMDRPLSSKSKTSMTFRIEIWLDNQSDTISVNFKIDLILLSRFEASLLNIWGVLLIEIPLDSENHKVKEEKILNKALEFETMIK